MEVPVNSWPTSCIILGIGGVGKTQVALQYTYDQRFSSDYDAIFWVRAETPLDISRSFSLITEKLQAIMTPGSSRDSSVSRDSNEYSKAIEWFETTANRWLLIFDNVDDRKHIMNYVPRHAMCGAIIITSQLSTMAPTTRTYSRVSVSSFSIEEGAQLIRSVIERTDSADDGDNTARRIAEFVGGLPLALTTICGYVNSSSTTLREALKELQASNMLWEREMSSYDADGQDYSRTLSTVFSVALAKVDEAGWELLRTLAFLNADMIPEEMLLQLFEKEYQYNEARSSLTARQLVTRNTINDEAPYLSLHRTLQLSVLHQLAKDQSKREAAFCSTFKLVQKKLPEPSKTQVSQPDVWPKYQLYVPQVLNLRRHALWPLPSLALPVDFAQILTDMGTYMWHSGLWDEAREALDTATQVMVNNGYDETHTMISDIDDVLGIIDDLIGVSQREDSFRRRRRALSIRKRDHDAIPEPKRTHNDRIRLYNAVANLACAYLQDENFEEAQRLMEDCLVQYRFWATDEKEIPFEYAKYYNHVAFVRMSQGHALDAIRMSRHACELLELHHKGPDASLVQFYRFQLGNHFLHAGRLEEALRINQDCLRDRIRLLSDQNSFTLESYSMTADLFFVAENLKEARDHMEKLFDISKHFLWTEEGLGMAHFRYSRILLALGKQLEAEEHAGKAQKIRDKFVSRYQTYLGRTELSEEETHDQMISIWAGRTTGRLNNPAARLMAPSSVLADPIES